MTQIGLRAKPSAPIGEQSRKTVIYRIEISFNFNLSSRSSEFLSIVILIIIIIMIEWKNGDLDRRLNINCVDN